jgi:polyphosphate:AMP phosphotransferase
MFENVITGSKISKTDFEDRVPPLRVDLVNAQYDLRDEGFSVVLVVAGNDRVGCNRVVDRIHEWMDARYISTHVFGAPTDEERERPRFWRYWRSLPADGRCGLYGGAWALNAVADYVNGELDDEGYALRLQRIRQFERELAADGTLILKFWIHLPHKEMKKRLKAAKKDPDQIWWIEDVDWKIYEIHDEVMPAIQKLFDETHTEGAPWHVVDGTSERFRDLTLTTIFRDALQQRLAAPKLKPAEAAPAVDPAPVENVLDAVDLSKSLDRDKYRDRLFKYQRKLFRLMRQAWDQQLSAVLAFEGWDAAGKGGAIRRITGALPAHCYDVVPIAAPTEEEKAHHYLWRFWRHLPRAGRMLIFDRTWYGRVLVERIEGFASDAEWGRAYEEINDFEEQLVERGIPVLKFWLHLSPEEQLSRFEARAETPYKKHKITDEDLRNREKWDDYAQAVNEMVTRTGTSSAPWHVIPANDKRYARVRVLKTVCQALENALPGGK